ncbi:MAG: hypothetical protein H6722_33010 [Sandaracinus sp.]|nr:hypothetical protein [Sandaracinus sp.]
MAAALSVLLLVGCTADADPRGALELRLRLPPADPGTTVWMQVARGDEFAFEVPWLVDEDQALSNLALYPAANEGADLAVSVLGREGEDLRVRLWLCPPEPRRAAPCDEPEPGVFPHLWLLFERPFFARRTSRWSAAFEGAYPDTTGWTTSPAWRDEPTLPWVVQPPLREPCDPGAGECLSPTRVDGCDVWVPACRVLGGDTTWPPDQRFCVDGTHDADDC